MEHQCEVKESNPKSSKTFQSRCPCKEGKYHLGAFMIEPKQSKTSIKLSKVQRKFFLGHGIKTTDPVEAANIFLNRDHLLSSNLRQHCYYS